MADKVLKLVFEAGDGKHRTLVISNPKEGLTEAQVRDAMKDIISGKMFVKDGFQKFAKIVSAKYYSSQSDEIFADKTDEEAAETKPANAQ